MNPNNKLLNSEDINVTTNTKLLRAIHFYTESWGLK